MGQRANVNPPGRDHLVVQTPRMGKDAQGTPTEGVAEDRRGVALPAREGRAEALVIVEAL